jgi:hypothetical protein
MVFCCVTASFGTINFPDSSDTWITGINPRGDTVGFYHSRDGKMHGFVLSKGKFVSIDIPGAISTVANGIDPEGNVVGFYGTPDGHTHGYLLAEIVD